MEGEITIIHGESRICIDIEDVEVGLLVDSFGLRETPTFLYHLDADGNKKVVPIGKKQKLVSGTHYHLPSGRGTSSGNDGGGGRDSEGGNSSSSSNTAKVPRRNVWSDDKLAEVVQNAIVACKAVYADNDLTCEKYLASKLESHNLEWITRSKNGSCCFLLAEEFQRKRLYVAFRGTQSVEDWKDNLRAYQVEGSGRMPHLVFQGKFHSGFLERASLFPVDRILGDDAFRDHEIVICGHSLGGAIATIVAIITMIEAEKRRSAGFGGRRIVRCVTFGSPLVGDRDLKEFCDGNDLSRNIFHLVSDGDPVPRLLSYAQCLSAMSSQIDNQVRALLSTYATKEGTNFYEDKKRAWIEQKQRYMDVLGRVVPALEPILDAATFVCPHYAGAIASAKLGSLLLRDVVGSFQGTTGPKSKASVYVNLGNYLFITSSSPSSPFALEYFEDDRILKCFEMSLEDQIVDTVQDIPVYHSVENYESFVHDWAGYAGTFSLFYTKIAVVGGVPIDEYVTRKVELRDRYMPDISSAELVRVQSTNRDILRLRLTGHNLFNIVLERCQFNFGFPFGSSEDKLIIKKMPMGTNVDRIIFEEDFRESPSISDHGTLMVLANQFGDCQYLLGKDQIRNLHIPTVNQISHHDSISVLIKRAIQRGMAISQVRKSCDQHGWRPANEKIIQEIMRLASITLEKQQFEDLCKMFEDTSKSIQFVLSNEAEYQRVQTCCDKMQDFLRKPLNITLEKSVAKKIGIGMATILGGATLAYLAGPGMVVVGVVEAVSMSMAGVAGAVGGIGAGLVTQRILTDRLADENYEQVLSFVTFELFKKLQNQELSKDEQDGVENAKRKKLMQEVSDLREDGSTFNLEKALLGMYDSELGVENFKGCDLEKCTEESKLGIIKRIECIKTIHSIRGILATQCYIGVVGMQDAGKTTFLHEAFGVGGPTGHFSHTDVPTIYEVDKRVLVVDFPGSNSLDYHAKTFSVCGAMNNLIIVIIPYTGDISQLISKEIASVFKVMASADSSEIILCVNKCGYELPLAIKEELGDKEDPIDFLRQRFAARLNEYYESNGSNFVVQKDRIFFTDWKIGDREDLAKVGICGVEAIKEEIKRYLLSNLIFDKMQLNELEQCMSKLSFNRT